MRRRLLVRTVELSLFGGAEVRQNAVGFRRDRQSGGVRPNETFPFQPARVLLFARGGVAAAIAIISSPLSPSVQGSTATTSCAIAGVS